MSHEDRYDDEADDSLAQPRPHVLRATTEHVSAFKHVIAAIKEIAPTGHLKFDRDYVRLNAIDNSHVCMVRLVIDTTAAFDEDTPCTRCHPLGLDFNSVDRIFKCASLQSGSTRRTDSSTMCIVHDMQDRPDVVSFMFECADKSRQREFDLNLLDIDSEDMALPDLPSLFVVTMSSAELQRICRELRTLGDVIQITVSSDRVVFQVKGGIVSGGSITCMPMWPFAGGPVKAPKPSKKKKGTVEPTEEQMDRGDPDERDIMSDGDGDTEAAADAEAKHDETPLSSTLPTPPPPRDRGTNSTASYLRIDHNTGMDCDQLELSGEFSLEYLIKFAKATPLSPYVALKMAPGIPITVEYPIIHGGDAESGVGPDDPEFNPWRNNIGYLSYFLAPKIDEDAAMGGDSGDKGDDGDDE